MVPQCYFVAPKISGSAVQISPSHSRAEIAGGFFYMKDRVKDRRVKDRDRNSKEPAVFLDQGAVLRKVSGIHTEEGQLERKLVVPLDLLKEFGHQHGVFAAGDADSNVISLLDKSVLDDCLFKAPFQIMFKLFSYALFDILLTAGGIIPVQGN